VAKLGHAHDARSFRDLLIRAMQAEGVDTSIWQAFILPNLTVFRAKNAYGRGCPWSCPNAAEVDYDPEQFPVAQMHCDTHTGMTTPLRAPNDAATIAATAAGIRKVLRNVDQLAEPATVA
jgi:perosamine synthetase